MALVLTDTSVPGVVTLTLNDPANLNAMSDEMAAEFAAAVESLRLLDAKPRAIIVTGAGNAFSAGGHLEMLQRKSTMRPEANYLAMKGFYGSFLSIRTLDIPTIAAINGAAIGAGLCVACACDIRIASSRAKFGFTFTKLGLHPGMGATYFVKKCVGDARAAELLLTARVIDADEALRMGLISSSVAPEELRDIAVRTAAEIAECGPLATTQLVQSLRFIDSSPVEQALEREATMQALSYASEEFKEGISALREKRKPRFSA